MDKRRPDLADIMILVALALLGIGFWWIWQPLALIVPGAILLVLGTAGAILKGRT